LFQVSLVAIASTRESVKIIIETYYKENCAIEDKNKIDSEERYHKGFVNGPINIAIISSRGEKDNVQEERNAINGDECRIHPFHVLDILFVPPTIT